MPRGFEVKRILGNIGRPGISMLIPPQNLILRSPDPAAWDLMGYNSFDGRAENLFKETTLHLSFTGYDVPILDGNRGA